MRGTVDASLWKERGLRQHRRDVPTKLRYLVLFAIAASPLFEIDHIKPTPLVFAASLFALHGIATLLARGLRPSTTRDGFSALLLFLWFEVSGIFLAILLAMMMTPATSDEHPGMPLGALFLGIPGGMVLGAAIAFIALRPAWRDRSLERWLLHVVGAALTAAAAFASIRG